MTDFREILRLRSLGLSQRQIASVVKASRHTVAKVLSQVDGLSVDWKKVSESTDAQCTQMLFPSSDAVFLQPRPNIEYVHKELLRRGVTLKLLWEEYVAECHEKSVSPLQYSMFCRCYRETAGSAKATMNLQRKPAEKCEVDWAGTPIYLQDLSSGEVLNAYLFVAALPYSLYAYVEAFVSMKQEDWILAHTHMYAFFGGATRILVPDNLKTGVTKHPKHEDPILNPTYQEMAEYYSTAVLPARVRAPKDKAVVEGTVGNVTTQMIAKLRNTSFYSLKELNHALHRELETFNHTPFQKKDGSRYSVFVEEEKPFLIPLPQIPFEMSTWKVATVQFNYHIAVDKMYYSVSYEYIKKKVDVRVAKNFIEIFYKGQRIGSYKRLTGRPGQYMTNPDHMPEHHKHYGEWNGDRLRSWASSLGPFTREVVDRILSSYHVEQQGYNGCRSLLKLSDTYAIERVEKACQRALSCVSHPRYKNIKLILEAGQDMLEIKPKRQTDTAFGYVRGASYYGGQIK